MTAYPLLAGKVAIVTGAASGLGHAHARLLAALGARVVVNDLAGADAAAQSIVDAGSRAIGHDGDIADWGIARALIDRAIEAFGNLHILVNNAGRLRPASSLDLREEDWDRMIRANLHTAVAPTHAAIGWWKTQPVGARAIVNTTSGSGLTGNAGRAPYGAGKAGAALLTLTWADELAPLGVRVNAVAPVARTPMTEQTPFVAAFMRKPDDDAFDLWDPANVSPMVAHLTSDACTLTGTIWDVRGGTIAQWRPWAMGPVTESDKPWTVDELAGRLDAILDTSTRDDPLRSGVKTAILGSSG